MEFYVGKAKATSKLLNFQGRQVLSFGTPLYRFKNEKDIRTVNFLQEEQVIHRTNDFIPAGNRHYEYSQHQVRAIIQPVPEAYNIDPTFLTKLLTQDTAIRKQYESYDPLRGNSLISITVFDEPIYVFSAGNSLSTAVFTFATKKKCDIDDDYKVDARFDNINIIDLFDLKYPIQQIVESPLMNREQGGVVGVRTTSTITLFKLDTTVPDTLRVIKLHHFHLAERTPIYPDMDYSMPCDLALSPFSASQYLFITNNGFMALVDIVRDEVLFEGKDEMSDDLDYASRWRGCSFSHIPSKYLLSSPECIKEWTVTKSRIHSRIISMPDDDRIFGFTFNYPLLCYSTTKEVRIFDIRSHKEPIIEWIHEMRDGPPTCVFMIPENKVENQWIIGAYSTLTERLSFIQLYYNSELTTESKRNVEIKDYFRFELPKNDFEPIYKKVEIIHSVGLSTCATLIPESGSLFYSIYRLFENGEIKVQYIVLGKNNSSIKSHFELKSRPSYTLDDDRFKKFYLAVEVSKLPSTLDSSKGREIAHIKNRPFRQYLEHIGEFNEAAGPFSSSKKMNVAEELMEAKTPVTYHELFGKEGYYNIKLEDLMSHLEEMKEIERAEELPYLDPLIKGAITDNKSEFQDQSKNLKEAHEKEIKLSKIRLHCPDQSNTSFQYLPKDTIYTSTMTTRILADDWSIDHTSSRNIEFTILDENNEIGKEVFTLASLSKRRKSVSFALDSGIPSISFSTPPLNDEVGTANLLRGESNSMFEEMGGVPEIESTEDTIDSSQLLTPQVSSQVLPGRHGGRPTKKPSSKKKKKQKTSGFR